MNRFKIFGVALITFALGFIVGFASQGKQSEDEYKYLRMFTDVLRIIKENYVEPVSTKDLIYGALNGMTKSLDPFSTFFTPKQYESFKQETQGEFGGVGIEIGMEKGRPVVISPIEGTPAFKAGIKPGDVILEIDGEDTSNMSLIDVVQRIRGKVGTKVQLTIYRKGMEKPMKIELERALIRIESVRWTTLGDVGYIKLSQFNENASVQVERALKELTSQRIKGIILDLRNDPGGLLSEAVNVADLFLPEGKLVVYTRGRNGETQKYFARRKPVVPDDLPVIVLINKGSASASEIVAGALQDYKRAIILGEKSFGKASVQNIIPLEDGSALKLTVAYYYTPLGRLIHNRGIVPDVQVAMDEKQEEALQEAIRQKKLEGKSGLILLPEKDPQLSKAIELIRSGQALKKVANL
ncbi:MAG: S41 family peptidase [Thermocrinis sp.]|uniref:S41 family peptidase n=1 Tax=Thermocrinis sp. TaxID=2024383 RepID=UPI003BFDD336